MSYYIKKLGHQELGSVSKDGKVNRGRYIYVSKNKNVLSFFPPLSKTVTNDYALLPLVPTYAKIKTYCNFVYHNDKYTKSLGTRDEYRLYLNKTLELGKLLFCEGDIVVFFKQTSSNPSDIVELYYVDIVKKNEGEIYSTLDRMINDSKIQGNHCFIEGEYSALESRFENEIRNTDVEVKIDGKVAEEIESSTSQKSINDLFNSSSFRDFVLVGYDYRCAITGNVISYKNFYNLEAAHIKPKSHGGYFIPSNGISMSRDIHWAFDKGFFTLTDDYLIQVHPEVESDFLDEYNGRRITLPKNQFFMPNKECMNYHREKVYGLFKTTGRL